MSGFEYTDIGITLRVLPQVNSAGFINLNIRPEVATRTGSVNFGGAAGAEIPLIASRRTETINTIKDGYTLAIGGLIENEIQNDSNKVPVLGDIPGLGNLFKSKTDSITQRNLIIFITARTLNPDGSNYRDIIDPRVLAELGLTERDWPGYVLDEDEKALINSIEQRRSEFMKSDAISELNALLDDLAEGEGQQRPTVGRARF